MEDQYYDIERRASVKETSRELRRKFLRYKDGSKCIVQLRGVRPFLSEKYDLTAHPNYALTADYDQKNYFDIEKFLNHKLVLKENDQYEVMEIEE